MISEICELLRKELYNTGYEYGFFLNGERCVPDMSKGFNRDFQKHLLHDYRIQDPEICKREKIGTCIEAVLIMKDILDGRKIPSRIWAIHNRTKNTNHCIMTFTCDGKIIYLELTPQSSKDNYGKEIIYSDTEEFQKDFETKGYDITEITEQVIVGSSPEFFPTAIKAT